MSGLKEVNIKGDTTAFGRRDHRLELPLNNMGKPAGEVGFREDQEGFFLFFFFNKLHLRCLLDIHLECLVSRRICLSSGYNINLLG